MIDGTGEAVISNDGSTILKQLQIDNPIGSLIVDLASEQDREVGDGTTTCTLIASEFLKSVERLVDQNVHTSKIISGFKLACKEACRFLMRENSFKIDISDEETVLNVAKTSISSKILSEYFFQKINKSIHPRALLNKQAFFNWLPNFFLWTIVCFRTP